MTFIMNLDIAMGFEVIKTAYEKKNEEQLWERYALDYTAMDEKTFLTFEQYKAKAYRVTVNLDKKQILLDAEIIKKADQGDRLDQSLCHITDEAPSE